jgi:predicted nucleic acid-binding protein
LKQLANGWHEVDPSDAVRETAVRFLRVHALRAADALQLSAAFIAAERRPSSLELVTLDDHLAVAARKEGFVLADVPSTEQGDCADVT